MHKIITFCALSLGVSLGIALVSPAHTDQDHMRRRSLHESQAPAASAAHEAPDWTVQYGVVANPRGVSGSFGAVLEGRNPASNIP